MTTPLPFADLVTEICKKNDLTIRYMVVEYDGDLHIQTESKDKVEITVGDLHYVGPSLDKTPLEKASDRMRACGIDLGINPREAIVDEEPWKWPKRWGWRKNK